MNIERLTLARAAASARSPRCRLFETPTAGAAASCRSTHFYEWQAVKGRKQPYALARKDHSPFGIVGLWENSKDPAGEWIRTFAIMTVPANELVARIHDRMPAILAAANCDRWLGVEPHPRDLLKPFPSELMSIWPMPLVSPIRPAAKSR